MFVRVCLCVFVCMDVGVFVFEWCLFVYVFDARVCVCIYVCGGDVCMCGCVSL